MGQLVHARGHVRLTIRLPTYRALCKRERNRVAQARAGKYTGGVHANVGHSVVTCKTLPSNQPAAVMRTARHGPHRSATEAVRGGSALYAACSIFLRV